MDRTNYSLLWPLFSILDRANDSILWPNCTSEYGLPWNSFLYAPQTSLNDMYDPKTYLTTLSISIWLFPTFCAVLMLQVSSL